MLGGGPAARRRTPGRPAGRPRRTNVGPARSTGAAATAVVAPLVVVAATVAGADRRRASSSPPRPGPEWSSAAVVAVASHRGHRPGRGRRRVVLGTRAGPPVQRGSFACSASSHGPDMSTPRCGASAPVSGTSRRCSAGRSRARPRRTGRRCPRRARARVRGPGPPWWWSGPRSWWCGPRSFPVVSSAVVAPPRLDEPEVSTAATTTAASTPTSTTVRSPVIAFFISRSLDRLVGSGCGRPVQPPSRRGSGSVA